MAAPWGRIRQGYMAGKSYKELSEKYHVSVKTIQNRASNEGWTKEKGKIKEEVGQKIHERVVRVRVQELEKLMEANGKLIDGLLAMAEMIQEKPAHTLFDDKRTLKNAEAFSRAIQTAVQTQRDLYKLPTLDQDFRKKEEAQRKREAKAKLDMDREKLELEKQKAKDGQTADAEIWKLNEPEGDVLDG